MTTRLCEQKLCELRGTGRCPLCSECGASPDLVSTDGCLNCYSCEHDIGYVRTGIRIDKVDQQIKIAIANGIAEGIIQKFGE